MQHTLAGMEQSDDALMKEISREPEHVASGMHQEQKDLRWIHAP